MTSQLIIHPTDFYASSKAALEFASSLSALLKAKLLIVHVAPPLTAPIMAGGVTAGFPIEGTVTDPTTSSALPETHLALQEDLHAITPTDYSVEYEHVLLEGTPAKEIVKSADKLGASQIIMGSHGRHGLTRMLVGSVAEAVIREATCPVTVVKAQKGNGEKQENEG